MFLIENIQIVLETFPLIIHYICYHSRYDVINHLGEKLYALEENMDKYINTYDDLGNTPIACTCFNTNLRDNEHLAIIKAFLKIDVDIELPIMRSTRKLIHLVSSNYFKIESSCRFKIIKILMEHGADMISPSIYGYTPLWHILHTHEEQYLYKALQLFTDNKLSLQTTIQNNSSIINVLCVGKNGSSHNNTMKCLKLVLEYYDPKSDKINCEIYKKYEENKDIIRNNLKKMNADNVISDGDIITGRVNNIIIIESDSESDSDISNTYSECFDNCDCIKCRSNKKPNIDERIYDEYDQHYNEQLNKKKICGHGHHFNNYNVSESFDIPNYSENYKIDDTGAIDALCDSEFSNKFKYDATSLLIKHGFKLDATTAIKNILNNKRSAIGAEKDYRSKLIQYFAKYC